MAKINNRSLLVFPTSRAIREFIDSHKSSNQLLPKCITIGDFFQKIITIGDKKFCEPELRIIYLKQALQNIDTKNLGINQDFNDLLKQSDYLFRFFSELTSEQKTISDLYNKDTYAYYHDHLEILQNVYDSYCALLNKHNMVDKITLPNEYILNVNYIEQFDQINIYYEGYFSSYEFSLITQIAKLTNLNIKTIQTKFNTKNITMFEQQGCIVDIGYEYDINLTTKTIENQNKIKQVLQKISVEPLSQRINQIGFIKYSVVNMIKNGIDPSKIVVLLPDESFHTILKLFDTEQYFNFAMGNTIKESKLYKVSQALYKILIDYEPKDRDKIAYYDLDINFIDKVLKIHLHKPLTKDIFDQLFSYLLQFETRAEVLEKIELLRVSLEKLLFHKSVEILLKDAFKILLQKLGQITLDDVMGGKITVMGLLETRAVEFEGVIVVDFNDHIIPKRSVKDKFISTTIKELVGLPTTKHREDLQKYYYTQIFSKAKIINISYIDDEQNGLSRFAHEIFDKDVFDFAIKPYESILYKEAQDIKHFEKPIIVKMDLSKKEWSATSLKTYLQCKRSYYYNYIAKIKEHTVSLKPQGFEMGSIIHKALQQLYSNRSLFSSKELFISKLYELINQGMGTNSYLILDSEIWKRKLLKFIDKEFERFSLGIESIICEQSFKFDHNGIILKGSIDRIDKYDGKSLAVLDYKTSSTLKIDNPKNYENSADFQLEFYYLAAQELFSDQNDIRCYYYNLNDATLKEEIMLDQKLLRLEDILLQLKTDTVNFEKCEDKKICQYCPYKIVCGR